MKTNDLTEHDEERIDALDYLIFRELGTQAQWRQTMQNWEERARRQRRLRILPVLSNIASVAALFILGLIVEAMMPEVKITDSVVDSAVATKVLPQVQSPQNVIEADSTQQQ